MSKAFDSVLIANNRVNKSILSVTLLMTLTDLTN